MSQKHSFGFAMVDLTREQFEARTAYRPWLIGSDESGSSYRVKNDLVAMIHNGTDYEYYQINGYFTDSE